jgi:hypothetical protein
VRSVPSGLGIWRDSWDLREWLRRAKSRWTRVVISSWGIDLLSANLAVPVPKSSVAAARAVPNTHLEVARPGALARWPNLDTIIRQPRSLRVEIYTACYTRIAFRMATRLQCRTLGS